jgi:putative NIF3 family GTP cyclohydrolase 1 type 2
MNDWLADMLYGVGMVTQRSVVQPIAAASGTSSNAGDAGYGRLIEFSNLVDLGRIVEALAAGLGGLRHVMVARPKHARPDAVVRSVGICAGSGYDVLRDCPADVLVTGEMSHHHALRMTMLGKCVVCVFHSNSERRFLRERLAPQLRGLLRMEDTDVQVLVSEEDEDPFEIWEVQKKPL